MTEEDLRKIVGSEVARRKGHPSWIESHMTSAGFPDLDACIGGGIIQVELKIEKPSGKVVIRPTQYKWFRDRVAAGGNPVMLIGRLGRFYAVHGSMVNSPCPIKHIDDVLARPHFSSPSIEACFDAIIKMSQGATNVQRT